MGTLIGAIIVVVLFLVIPLYKREHTFNTRVSPKGTNWEAMNRDLANGMSKDNVKDKFNRGDYDIKN